MRPVALSLGLRARNRIPITTNTTPAIRRSQIGDTNREIASPPATAIAELATSASAEPKNTVHFDDEPAENESAASCVLSPSSAMKMAVNVEASSFQSMAASCHENGARRTRA